MAEIMNTSQLQTIILTSLHIVLLLLLAPFINTFIKKVKAIFQGRTGPPLLQGYYDLIKYFYKETVVSNQTSWIFLATPLVVFSTTLVASILVPTFTTSYLLNILGGVILLIYLFGLGRFFMSSSAMEPNSSFCSMASSREMMLSILIEPVMLLSLFIFVLTTGSNNITDIINNLSNQGIGLFTPIYLLTILALFTASLAEMCRIPFDNPETHYELTMIHEGMLLEYSGKYLGLMLLSNWLKQLLIISLIANLIFPWCMCANFALFSILLTILIYITKILFLSIIIAFIETAISKVRLFKVREILMASFVMSIIALVIAIQKGKALGL